MSSDSIGNRIVGGIGLLDAACLLEVSNSGCKRGKNKDCIPKKQYFL
jgi:hypothetical protein